MSRLLLSSALVSALVALGCGEEDFDPPRPPGEPTAVGELVFDWSIQGRQDADACVEVGAISFDAIVVDEGFVVRDLSVPCEDFEASVDLYVDDFLARSSLLDERSVPAVGRIIEDLFMIEEGRVTHLVIDFLAAPVPMDPIPVPPIPGPDGASDAGPDVAPDASPPGETPPDEETPPDGVPDGGPDAATADQP